MTNSVARLTRPALRMGLFAAFVLAVIPPITYMLMEQARISVVLVADADNKLVGALSINDLLRAKVI